MACSAIYYKQHNNVGLDPVAWAFSRQPEGQRKDTWKLSRRIIGKIIIIDSASVHSQMTKVTLIHVRFYVREVTFCESFIRKDLLKGSLIL